MYCVYLGKDKKFDIKSEEYTCCENSRILALYDGVPNEKFTSLLENEIYDADWMNAFLGPFQLIVFNKISGELLITQHFFGNGKNLYYHKSDSDIYFSSSLKKMRILLNKSFRLNRGMLPHFLYNGFIAGEHTLVEGVYKLEAGVCYVIKGNVIEKRHLLSKIVVASSNEHFSEEELEIEYNYAIQESVSCATQNKNEILNIALSGGYDSNCILYNLRKIFPNQAIYAFSVGGVKGVDETQIASGITLLYNDVSFFKSLVTPKTLDSLDEIVEILEGSVYERGIFLQYELAKMLHEHKVTTFICGECADQVFHQNTYEDTPPNIFLYGYKETPYQMAVYAVLRKSRMMMDAFGIQTYYPFLTPKLIDIGYKTRSYNGVSKEFHKAQCKKKLPNQVVELIGKQGGSTDLSALFPDDFDCSSEIKKRKYYAEDFMLTKKYAKEEAERDYYLNLLYLESFERQFCV